MKKNKVKLIYFFIILFFIILLFKPSLKIKFTIKYLNVNDEFSNEFKAYYKHKDITNKIKIKSFIKNKPGVYKIKFTYKDKYVYKNIRIKDTIKPKLLLNNGKYLKVLLNEQFIDPGYIVKDNYDLKINAKRTGKVNTKKVGKYTLKYSAYDSSGNMIVKKRIVEVVKDSPMNSNIKDFSLKGYYSDVMLEESNIQGLSYTDSFVYAGDSQNLYYSINNLVKGNNLWYRENVTIDDLFNKNIYINQKESNITLLEAYNLYKPKYILLSIGSDSTSNITIDNFIKKYKQLLITMKTYNNEGVIIVQSIFPVAKMINTNKLINDMNFRLLQLCSSLNVYFLDTEEVLKNKSGVLKDGYYRTTTNQIGIHLNREGNDVAFNYFKNHAYK